MHLQHAIAHGQSNAASRFLGCEIQVENLVADIERNAAALVADFDGGGAKKVAEKASSLASPEFGTETAVDLSSAESLGEALRHTILEFGGIDVVVNTTVIYPVPSAGGEW